MTSFDHLVSSRRMVRAFRSDPIDRELLTRLVELAARSPSAGNSQGWELVVLEGARTETFWSATMTPDTRATFRWQHLFAAPVVALSFASPRAYLDRYSESDKLQSGLGSSVDAWPAPYWTIDASFATMTLLLAAHDAGLGALFFGVFHGEDELRDALHVPADRILLGAVALGYERVPGESEHADPSFGVGRSARRKHAAARDIIHFGDW
ncbi:MAG: nitroreductase family protein [Ilumatobacteraceae bacterium]